MSNVKAALDALKAAMDNPNPELANPYESYSLSELEELVEEIENEIDRLPSYAYKARQYKLEELSLITQAIQTIENRL